MMRPKTHGRKGNEDAIAAAIRDAVGQAAVDAIDTDEYRALPTEEQISALLGGMVAGIPSVAFSYAERDARASVVEGMKLYIDEVHSRTAHVDFNEQTLQ